VATSKTVAIGRKLALEEGREDGCKLLIFSDLSQLVAARKDTARMAVNRRVVGSSPNGSTHLDRAPIEGRKGT
jgi:nitrogen fixation/metabolism regulation signal transduction histidine kinase